MVRLRRRWLLWTAQVLAVVVPVIGCVGFCWTYLWSDFSAPGMRVSYRYGGTRGAVTFAIVDRAGALVPGVTVATESHSGWTQDATTDGAGRAVIWPGEREVLAVRVGGQMVRFRPRETSIEVFFTPSCDRGLVVNVFLDP
ncbi:MAG: hypothetical protein K1X57_11635 [Gemmataceae bacterium]|nr:hypothetical protein [Gemmataceae bacterium]